MKKLYQHSPQIAKTDVCVINVQNSVTSERSSRQFFWMLFWMPLLRGVPWAPSNGTTSTPPKLVVTLAPNHSTLQWHPAMAPWCHVQSAKVVRRPPLLLEVRTPIAIALGKYNIYIYISYSCISYIICDLNIYIYIHYTYIIYVCACAFVSYNLSIDL